MNSLAFFVNIFLNLFVIGYALWFLYRLDRIIRTTKDDTTRRKVLAQQLGILTITISVLAVVLKVAGVM